MASSLSSSRLVDAARVSVGQHHGDAYRLQVQYACDDVDVLRRRARELDNRIETTLGKHEVGTLLTTISGIGPTTADRIVAEVGDFGRFASAEKLAAYVGAIPGLRHFGKSRPKRGALTTIGHAALRTAKRRPRRLDAEAPARHL